MRSWRGDQLRRQIDAQPRQQLHHVGRPAGSHRRGAEGIFQNQVPADDPGEEFAQGRVAIGVGRSGDGNQRGEFGVTQAGESARNPGKDERQHDGRPGVQGRHRSRQHENAGADDGPDAERDQIGGPQRALEGVLANLVALLLDHVEGLFGEKIRHGLCAA